MKKTLLVRCWPLILLGVLGVPSLGLWREGNTDGLAFAQAPRSPQQTEEASELATRIRRILSEQQQAWNRGDIDAFMEHYLKSDELTFSSGGTITRGWESTLANYRKRYPDREAMGRLEFSGLEVRSLGENATLVLGNWQLEREAQPDIGGNFTLVFQRLDGRWLIVHDHTSRRVDPPGSPAEDPGHEKPGDKAQNGDS